MGCIYKIVNSINGKIYIGKTTKTAKQRFSEHCTESKFTRKSGKSAFMKAIAKYGKENFIVSVIVEGDYSELELNELEKYYIQLNKSFVRGVGYNMTLGGECFPLAMWTAERRKRQSESQMGKNNPMYGRTRNGGNFHEKWKKEFYQYSFNGHLINKWVGVKETARKLGVHPRCLMMAMNGDRKTWNGYVWSYVELPNSFFVGKAFKKSGYLSVVEQYDFDNNKVAEYSGARNAGKLTGILGQNISLCANGKLRQAGGYFWRFKQTEPMLKAA